MKNTFKLWLGMLVMVLIFGMAVVGCNNGSDDDDYYAGSTGNTGDTGGTGGLGLNGTWYSSGNVYKYYFNNGDYEHNLNGNPYRKGTYTTTTDSITMTITHIGTAQYSSSYSWLDSRTWYSRDEFRTAYLNYYRQQYREAYEPTRRSLKETYNTLVSAYGVSYANEVFYTSYGTTDIDSYVDSLIERQVTQVGNSIDSSINSLFPSSNTVAYSLSGNTVYIGGVMLTRQQ